MYELYEVRYSIHPVQSSRKKVDRREKKKDRARFACRCKCLGNDSMSGQTILFVKSGESADQAFVENMPPVPKGAKLVIESMENITGVKLKRDSNTNNKEVK